MNRKQTETPVKKAPGEPAGKEAVGNERSGEGAASALTSLKKREHDRAKALPAADRPAD